MYHHRLTRAYLGASRHQRKPNAFTGFDAHDDVELAELAGQRPLHIINTTLNMRIDPRTGTPGEPGVVVHVLAPALRIARLVRLPPFGRIRVQPAAEARHHARHRDHDLGRRRQPADGRLHVTRPGVSARHVQRAGWACGSAIRPRPDDDTWRARDPKARIAPIFSEMLGWTTDADPYVFLSDGSHFDNLGLWEMVLRRVRHIVIVDSGSDP